RIELRRGERAERVGREVAPETAGPMDVLQAPVAHVLRANADELLHPVVERAGEVPHLEVAADHRTLEPVAQDDVQRVRDLVGVDANEASLDLRDVTEDRLVAEALAGAAEDLARGLREPRGELRRSRRLHLP